MSFYKTSLLALFASLFGLFIGSAHAAPLIIAESQVLSHVDVPHKRARVVLSAVKRVSNALRIEREEWVEGRYRSWLLQLDDQENLQSVLEYYRNELERLGKIEFSCAERACGTSSNWANKVFSQSILSGRDSNQHYLAAFVTLEGEPGWVSVYIVKNGRRHNYVYIQFVSDPTALSGEGSSNALALSVGRSALAGLNGDSIKQLFSRSKSVQIGLYTKYEPGMSERTWRARTHQTQLSIIQFLDAQVPSWKEKSDIVVSPPQVTVTDGVGELDWLTLVGFPQ